MLSVIDLDTNYYIIIYKMDNEIFFVLFGDQEDYSEHFLGKLT